jgi:hypothetical protein
VGTIKRRKYKARSQKNITEKRVTGVLMGKLPEVKKLGLKFSEDLAVAIRC